MQIEDLKRLVKKEIFCIEMEAVFFEAMNAGYAATEKLKKGTVAELPGSKLVPPYVRGSWKVTDVYHVTPLSSRSGGTTIISYAEVPVWMMQYFGEYEEEAIPCLKAALRDAYSRKLFCGGRGERDFQFEQEGSRYPYRYRNLYGRSTFELFSGEEKVVVKMDKYAAKVLGWHRYQGGLML